MKVQTVITIPLHFLSDLANSSPSLSLRAKSVTHLSAYSGKDEPPRTHLSSSHGYIHQLLSKHQQLGGTSEALVREVGEVSESTILFNSS